MFQMSVNLENWHINQGCHPNYPEEISGHWSFIKTVKLSFEVTMGSQWENFQFAMEIAPLILKL